MNPEREAISVKAVYIEGYGNADVLKYGDVPMPEVRSHDVLIESYAASVNPVDWKLREGYLQKRMTFDFPLILGWDVAGVVKDIGSSVTRFKVGDKVFSRPDIARNGTYAEFVAVDEKLVAMKPQKLTFGEAASVPLAGLTAWEALVEISNIQAGQRVLVHAGAGGVGAYAIQLAKAYGAIVSTTASRRNAEFVASLGADEVIAYDEQDFEEILKDQDVVFDTIGGDVQTKSISVLKKGGILVSIVAPPDKELLDKAGVRGEYFFLQPDGDKLAKLGALFDEGKMRPVVGEVFPLERTADAHRLSETHHARGKIVVSIHEEQV